MKLVPLTTVVYHHVTGEQGLYVGEGGSNLYPHCVLWTYPIGEEYCKRDEFLTEDEHRKRMWKLEGTSR